MSIAATVFGNKTHFPRLTLATPLGAQYILVSVGYHFSQLPAASQKLNGLLFLMSEILIYQALHSHSVNKLRKLYCLRPQGDKNITRRCATSLSASMLR